MTVRELTEEVHWISECYEDRGRHLHVSLYLIQGEETILVDSGSEVHGDRVLHQVDELVADGGVDAMVLTHSDLPHSGNISRLRDRWGDFEVFTVTRAPEITLGDDHNVTVCDVGDTLTLGDRDVHLISAPLKDILSSTWIYDAASSVLFTADGFGHYHDPGECDAFSNELDGGISEADVMSFHEDLVPWLPYVDPGKLNLALETIVDSLDLAFIAPIHGNPVVADDVDAYLETLQGVVGEIARRGNPYTGRFIDRA